MAIFQPTPPKDYFCASKITTTFDYGPFACGTGCVVEIKNNYWLLTCKHVVSPQYKVVDDRREIVRLDVEFFVTAPTVGIGVSALPQRLTILEHFPIILYCIRR
jgi:hypothetical protein